MSDIEVQSAVVDRTVALVPLDEIRAALLGVCYGLATRGRDRNSSPPVGRYAIGQEPLLSAGQAIVGERLALESVIICYDCARAFLGVAGIAKSTYTEAEARRVATWEFEISVAAHRLAEEGFVDDQPKSVTLDGEPLPLGPSGLPKCFSFTWQGIKEAKRVVPGTRWESGPVTWDEGAAQVRDARMMK